MAESTGHVAALDFGATSGRVIVGEVGANVLRIQQFARFANRPVRSGGKLHWNVLDLWQGALDGIALANRSVPELISIATDSWGVDYGLVRKGSLLANPVHYRDDRTSQVMGEVNDRLSVAEQYQRAGVNISPINTIYQLAVDSKDGLLGCADNALLMPDLFSYWLSGERISERTMASTTGLMSAASGTWNDQLLDAAGITPGLLPEIVAAGTKLGRVRDDIVASTGVARSLEVVTVGAHDTASAVVAVPMPEHGAVFISCGTWGLVGLEQDQPVLTEQARTAGFTNESGVDGRYLVMRNSMGLWMLSESIRQWESQGHSIELDSLLQAAAAVETDLAVIDVDDPIFSAPGDMPARITQWCHEHSTKPPEGKAQIVRCIIESLAMAFARAVQQVSLLTQEPISQINIVGGGSQNELLCQSIASVSGLPVFAGPVEATALGNILVQARTAGLLGGTLDDLREIVRRTHVPRRFDPR